MVATYISKYINIPMTEWGVLQALNAAKHIYS